MQLKLILKHVNMHDMLLKYLIFFVLFHRAVNSLTPLLQVLNAIGRASVVFRLRIVSLILFVLFCIILLTVHEVISKFMIPEVFSVT